MVIPIALVLERALRDAGIPIDGVSIGDLTDRTLWRAFYQASATAQQRTQGDALLQSIDPQDATTVANIKADFAQQVAADLLASAIQAVWEAIPSPTSTLVQVRNRSIQLYKQKL